MNSIATSYDNPLRKSFYIPKDKISTFVEVLKKYTNLPPTSYYDTDIPQSHGLSLLELKKENVIREYPIVIKTKTRKLSNRQEQEQL